MTSKSNLTNGNLASSKENNETEVRNVEELEHVEEIVEDEDDDQIINAIGNMGRWQARRILFIFCFKFCLAIPNMGTTFIGAKTDFWCERPAEFRDMSREDWRKMSSPVLVDAEGMLSRDRCNVWDSPDHQRPSDNATKPCTAWEFDRSTYTNTIIQDFDLVCGNTSARNWAQSSYYFGFLLGIAVSGWLSDHFGRMRTIVPLLSGMATFGILSAFSPTVQWFMLTRFLQGCCHSVGVIFCWTVELVGGKWQVIVGMSNWGPWVVGWYATALISYLAPDWRDFQLISSIPVYTTLVFYCVLPESPRWLLSVGRLAEAEGIVRKAAKENGKSLPEDWKLRPINFEDKEASTVSVFSLCSSLNMTAKTFLLFFNWFSNSLVYFGLALKSGSLGGTIMGSYLLNGLMEIPAYTICTWVIIAKGRKLCYVTLMILGGIALFAIMGIPLNYFHQNWPSVALSLFGKMCISGEIRFDGKNKKCFLDIFQLPSECSTSTRPRFSRLSTAPWAWGCLLQLPGSAPSSLRSSDPSKTHSGLVLLSQSSGSWLFSLDCWPSTYPRRRTGRFRTPWKRATG